MAHKLGKQQALRRPSEARRRHAGHVAAQVVMHVAGIKAQGRPRLIGIAHGGKARAPRRAEKLDGVGDRHRWLLAHIAGNSEGKIGKRKDRPTHDRPHAVEVLRPHFELAHRMTRREVNHPAPTSLAGKPIAREDLSHLFKGRAFRNKRCHLHPPLYQNRRITGISSGLYAPTCRPHPHRRPKTPHVCVLISSQSHIPSLPINSSSSTRCFIKVPHNTFVTRNLKRKHTHFFRAISRRYAIKTAWARMHCVTSMGYINESPNICDNFAWFWVHSLGMDITICDATAFEYWRIPPIVALLLVGRNDDIVLRRILRPGELKAFRTAALSELPLCKRFLQPNPSMRRAGKTVELLRPAIPLIAAAHDGPVDILVNQHSACHTSTLLRPRLWSSEVTINRAVQIGQSTSVITPALALLQIAARAGLIQTVLLASELCGSFAIYEAPPLIREWLQTIQNRTGIPAVGDWKPCLDSQGQLTNLWSRPALATVKQLMYAATVCAPRRGNRRLAEAAGLIAAGAASPFEVQAGVLLGFPRNLGGEGHGGFTFNKKIPLTRDAQLLAQRNNCYCDIYWESGLDVECQSSLVHQNEGSFLSDSDRTAALRRMGIDVLPMTYGQLADASRFDALSRTISNMLGKPHPTKSGRQKQLTTKLRQEVLVDWNSLHKA